MEVTFTYKGVRQRAGQSHAVIAIQGALKDSKDNKSGVQVSGTADFDLSSFQVAQAHVTAKLDIPANINGKMSTLRMETDTTLERLLGKELLNINGQLTKNDPLDVRNCPYKTHPVMLEAGKPCVVSMESPKVQQGWFDTYLVILDPSGKVLHEDDDGGTDLNAMVVFTPTTTGQHRIVATCYPPAALGNYNLIVRQ
jgi:hypothetical protein